MKSQKNKLIVNNFQNVYYKITFNAVNLSKKPEKRLISAILTDNIGLISAYFTEKSPHNFIIKKFNKKGNSRVWQTYIN